MKGGGHLPFPSLEVTLAAPVTRSGPVVRAQAMSEDGSLPPTRSCQPGLGPVAPGARQLPAGLGSCHGAERRLPSIYTGHCPALPWVLSLLLKPTPDARAGPAEPALQWGPGGETDSPASCSASFPESSCQVFLLTSRTLCLCVTDVLVARLVIGITRDL